jgi:anion-transporting  ArsA/GET3 family ATPase
MESLLAQIEEKKFLLLTGKGGTGKSTLSAALALYFSARGKKVLLTEIGRVRDRNFLRLGEFFPNAGELSMSPSKVLNPLRGKKTLLLSCIDPGEALVEYIGLKLGSKKLAQVVLKNKIAFNFLDTIPGLTELVSLGKLWHEAIQDNGPDMIILDAPASGHAMAMLLAPRNFASLTRIGPLFRDASAMQEFFSNQEKTAIIYCTLPEEVPYEESLEFHDLLQQEGLAEICVVNKCFPLRFKKLDENLRPEKDSPFCAAWDYAQRRMLGEKKVIQEYRGMDTKLAFLPFIPPDGELEKAHMELARTWLGERL